jgi:hypothetical protein
MSHTHVRTLARVGLSVAALMSATVLTLASAGAGVAGASPRAHWHHAHHAHDATGISGVVTAVSATSLSITDDGQSTSFTLNAATTFNVNGVTIPSSAIVLGAKVRVSVTSPATTPPTAASVTLLRGPNVALTQSVEGVVSSVSPTQIVITHDGQSLTFAVVASTNFVTKTGAGTIASVTAGSRVRVVSLSASPTTAGAVFIFASESSHGHGVNGTVSSVSPTQLVITHDGQSLTFTLSTSTTYAMMNGASATFANVTVGSRVRVVASTTSLTTAGEVFVFANAPTPQSVEGVVSAVTPTQIVITHDGQSLTYSVVASTTFAMRGAAASIANVTVGSHVRIVASTTSSSTAGLVIIAASESVAPTSVKGIVTAISPTSITLASRSGLVTFTINASTVFMKDHQALVPTDVTVGAEVCVVATAATTTPLTAGMVKLLGH